MSGVRWRGCAGPIATGTSAKTLMQIVAASNHRVLVNLVSIAFKGVSNTGVPITVEFRRQTTAGTMSSLTLVKFDSTDDETLEVTALHTATAEPTAGDLLFIDAIHPQMGKDYLFTHTESYVVPGGTKFGIIVTAAADVNCVITVGGDE